MLVATAGHVDHGKSTLVRRLTGTDPDRWAEERERGLTIDLGFAWAGLPSGRVAALVDVPGHRRFVANALAGCGAVDGVMLAVSAREGWMPQTEEHVAMLGLLGAPGGVVALTFADRVDPATLARARDEVAERLAGSFLDGAAIVATGPDGAGDAALLQALDEAVARCPTESDHDRPRLWIDRSFLLDGVGRVVTGALTGGSVRVGDRLTATDGTTSVGLRVRSARRDGHPVEVARPGARVALAVRADGVPERGQAVVRTAQWQCGLVLHVALATARGQALPSGRGDHHAFTGTWSGPVRLGWPRGGDRRYVRLHLTARGGPFAPGDRLVLRDVGRGATVAGGTVLAVEEKGARPSIEALARREAALRAPARSRAAALAAALLAEHEGRVAAVDVFGVTGRAQPTATRVVGRDCVSVPALRRARRDLLVRLGEGPVSPEAGLERAAGAQLVRAGVAVDRDGALHPPGRDPRQHWHEAVAALDAAVADGRLEALFTPEAARAAGAGGADLRRLVSEGLVVAVGPFLATRAAHDALVVAVRARLASGPATAAELKTATGLTRRHAIPLLEALDREGVTVRDGDRRTAGPRRPPAP